MKALAFWAVLALIVSTALSFHPNSRNSPALLATVLRGANTSHAVAAPDLQELDSWNTNLIRFQIVPSDSPPATPGTSAYHQWFLAEIGARVTHLESILPQCELHGLKVLVDLHRPPGSIANVPGSYTSLYSQAWARQLFLASWDEISQRLSAHPIVWGYDLLNEPQGSNVNWRPIVIDAINTIRQNDSDAFIVIEPRLADLDYISTFTPINAPKLVYSIHFYRPMAFTHQLNPNSQPWTYPGTISGTYWNKDTIRQKLQVVEGYQTTHGVRILLGEFAAARWSPGAIKYMRDVISVAEEFGWDWTFHAFREADVWNLELGPDSSNTTPLVQSNGERVMRNKMAAN